LGSITERCQWQDEQSLRAFRNSGDHLAAMRQVGELASEMAYATWELPGEKLPDWKEAHERLLREGRFTKLPHGTPSHQSRQLPSPWAFLSTAMPFIQARNKAKKA
jgi:hypothetical protein